MLQLLDVLELPHTVPFCLPHRCYQCTLELSFLSQRIHAGAAVVVHLQALLALPLALIQVKVRYER